MTTMHIVVDIAINAGALACLWRAWRATTRLHRVVDKTRAATVSMHPEGTHPALYHEGWCDARLRVLTRSREIYEEEL